MKVSELKKLLETREDLDIVIRLSDPSIGSVSMASIDSISIGFDWENGKILINPSIPLVRLKEKEALWQSAHDFIYQLSEQKTYKDNPTFLAKRAKSIIERSKLKIS